MSSLPPPRNEADMYLAAIYDRLGQILDRLPEPPAVQVEAPKVVELREPEPAPSAPLSEPEPKPAVKRIRKPRAKPAE